MRNTVKQYADKLTGRVSIAALNYQSNACE